MLLYYLDFTVIDHDLIRFDSQSWISLTCSRLSIVDVAVHWARDYPIPNPTLRQRSHRMSADITQCAEISIVVEDRYPASFEGECFAAT